jgi:glycosyltransferase involved in cell wall biosynthesis
VPLDCIHVKSVSIVTALFNKAPYVYDTIRSVLEQTLPDWEMIVVDNGSTDEGPEIVRQCPDSRVRLVHSPKHGPGAARNFGLGQAMGEWVLFLDADDLITSDFLSNRLALAQKNHPVELVVGCWEEFSDDQPTRVLRHPAAFGQSAKFLEQSAIAFAPWALHAAVIRRRLLTSDLFWTESLDGFPSEDTAFWFPVICGASIAWTQQAGALYRVRTPGSRNEIHDTEKWIRAVIGVINHNVDFLRRKGSHPDAEQCASIARVLESSYRLGLAKRSRAAARLALEQAAFWLAQCPASSRAMALRKYLGLRVFNLIRYGVI